MCKPQRNVVWAWHTSMFYPIRTFHTVVHAQARTCQQSNAYFKGMYLFGEHPLRMQHHSPEVLSIDPIARENSSLRVKNFRRNNFVNGWKLAKLKTCENLALYNISCGLCTCTV